MTKLDAFKSVAPIRLFGFIAAVVTLALSAATDPASSRPLTDRSLADIRGTTPWIRNVNRLDCTGVTIAVYEDNGGTAISGSGCNAGNLGATCISCRSGTFLANLQQGGGPPGTDPNSGFMQTCGTGIGSNVGTTGTCDVGTNSNFYCRTSPTIFQCSSVQNFKSQ